MAKNLTKEDLLGLMKLCLPVLEKYNISYCLAEGVLKDWHINGDIVSHHSDLDIHILKDDQLKLVAALDELKAAHPDYNVNTNSAYKNTFIKDRPEEVGALIIEFMFLFVEEDLCYFMHNNDKYFVSQACVSDTQEVSIDGVKIMAPRDIDSYLRGAYPPTLKLSR